MAVRPLPVENEQWQRLDDLTSTGDYHAVKQWLAAAQADARHRGDVALENLLTVAVQLCETCFHHQEELVTYKQEYETAVTREQTMRQQLCNFLRIMAGKGQLNGEWESLSDLNVPFNEAEKSSGNRLVRFWRRIRNHYWSSKTQKSAGADHTAVKPPSIWETAVPEATLSSLTLPDLPETKPPVPVTAKKSPTLLIYCLGSFRVFHNDRLIDEWNGLKGQHIFKYLAINRGRPIPKDVLMELFWPEVNLDASRRNLHQAIYSLRQTLRNGFSDFRHILFENDCYLLNPDLEIWLDFAEFESRVESGRQLLRQGNEAAAMVEFKVADTLYQGVFLAEDLYEDWVTLKRDQLQNLAWFRIMFFTFTDEYNEFGNERIAPVE